MQDEMNDLQYTTAEDPDIVKVVRCRECKWHNEPGCAISIVDDSDRPGDEDYCSYGERKDE